MTQSPRTTNTTQSCSKPKPLSEPTSPSPAAKPSVASSRLQPRSPNHTSGLAQVRPRRSKISKPVQSKTIVVPSQPLDQLVVDRKREAFRQHRRVEDPSLLQPPAEESTLVRFRMRV
ncbi:hypothetical protein AAC387_Pa01g3814 [Persea americana]